MPKTKENNFIYYRIIRYICKMYVKKIWFFPRESEKILRDIAEDFYEISLKCVGTNPLLSATVSDRLGNT